MTDSFDNNGNPTTYKGASGYQYDLENRLTQVGSTLTNQYRGDGLRAWKSSSSGKTYFLYDGALPIVEFTSNGSSNTITATNTFGANGLLSRDSGGSSQFYTFDPQGNVCQRLDSSGNVLSSHFFDAYGAEYDQPSGTKSGVFGYGGQWGYYTDGETGLVLLTNRYYDPARGRFLTRDPIGYAGGTNLYSYVGNNPLAGIDPLGLCAGPGGDWLDWGSNFFAGWGDTLSFGATILIREGLGANGVVSRHSTAYVGGQWLGFLHSAAIGGAAAAEFKAASGVRLGAFRLNAAFPRGIEWVEGSHWIPARAFKWLELATGIPRSLGNGGWNIEPMWATDHALNDPYRYQFMPRAWKAVNEPNSPLGVSGKSNRNLVEYLHYGPWRLDR